MLVSLIQYAELRSMNFRSLQVYRSRYETHPKHKATQGKKNQFLYDIEELDNFYQEIKLQKQKPKQGTIDIKAAISFITQNENAYNIVGNLKTKALLAIKDE